MAIQLTDFQCFNPQLKSNKVNLTMSDFSTDWTLHVYNVE